MALSLTKPTEVRVRSPFSGEIIFSWLEFQRRDALNIELKLVHVAIRLLWKDDHMTSILL